MNKNVKSIFLISTLFILLFSITALSATDISDDTSILDNTENIVVSEVSADTPVKIVDTTPPKSIKKESKTHIVNNNSIKEIFNKEGTSPYSTDFNASLLSDDVSDGDTLDFQGEITGNYNLTINKAVNIISSTHDALISLNTTCIGLTGLSPGNHFIIGNEGSYTNVTGINFYNTQIFVYNSTGVTLDNISAIVEDQPIGGGIGQTSIRENSTNVTVKNSYFYTRNNGGSSTLVLAWAENCTILNNTIKADGNVGNLLYLTTFNLDPQPPTGIIPNSNNKIINNTIGTLSQGSTDISWSVVLSGSNNTVDGNEILRGGIQSQYGGATTEGNIYITNNNVYAGGLSSSLLSNYTVENNTFGGNINMAYNATIKNNTFDTLTITQQTSNVTNNTFKSLNIQRMAINNYIAENTITGTANIQTSNNTFIKNTVINSADYTVKVTTSNNNISDNYLVAGTTAGNKTLIISGTNIIENNGPNPIGYTITDETYTNFFDENGYFINDLIENYDILILEGTFNNKNFIFNNTKNSVNGVDCTINNGQIQVTDNGQITLNNITINNDENINTTIILNSDKNTIGNITINHETTNNVNEISIQGTNNNIIKNNINITSPTSSQDKINAVTVTTGENTINNNNIIVNTNNNAITKVIHITKEDSTTPIQKISINNNNINIITKGEVYAVDIDVPAAETNITNNQITINSNENIHAINCNELKKRSSTYGCSISSNTINLNSTKNVEAITITEHNNDVYVGNNNMNITGAKVEAIKMLSTIYTLENSMNAESSWNTIKITAENTTVMTLMGHCNSIQCNVSITSNETVVVHYINAYNSYANFYYTKPLNLTKGTAGIIENSFNTYISGTITTEKAIKYINVNNLTCDNIGPITSEDEYTIIFDSCENITLKNTYLISDDNKKGGDDAVQVINGNNVTITSNKPDLAYITDETYPSFFDENNKYTSTKTAIVIGPDLNSKTMIFDSYINMTSINDAVINNGVIELRENAINSIINNITTNNTQIIIKSNNTQLTNSTLYQDNENTPIIRVNNAKTVTIRYNNITGNTNNLQIIFNNTQTNIEYCNITSLTQTQTPLIIADNESSGYIRYNTLITSDLIGALSIENTNSNMIITSNQPKIIMNLTDDNYHNYFNEEGIYTGSNIDILELASDIYNKNFTFNTAITLDNPYNYTIYNTTITNINNELTLTNLNIKNINYSYPTVISSNIIFTNNTLYTETNNQQIIILSNFTTTTSYFTNNEITSIGDNNTIITINNYRFANNQFVYNNITSIGDNNTVIYYTNITSNNYIVNNYITSNSSIPSTIIIIDNARVRFNQNTVLMNTTQNGIPIIKVITTTNGQVNNNYIESLDLVGDNAIETPGTKSGNIPTTTGYTSLINILTDSIYENMPTKVGIITTDSFGREITGTITATANGENTKVTYNSITITAKTTDDVTVQVTYTDPNGKYNTTTITKTLTVTPVSLTVNTITATVGDTINITARITAGNETFTDINKGKVTFKVNGKTLKDPETGKVIYAKVVNGVATIENYVVPDDWTKEGTTIQAVYSGSTQCDKLTSEKTNMTITTKEITLTTEDVMATPGQTVTLTATLSDNTINTGKIVFKVNGKSIKDADGKVIYAKVVNGQVSVEYTIPADMKAKDYTITAVYMPISGDRLTAEATLTVSKE